MAENIIRDINNVLTVEYEINEKIFARSYGKNGYLIERDGVKYSEAIDPMEYVEERVYTETAELPEGEDEEATIEDYQSALKELGVLEEEVTEDGE